MNAPTKAAVYDALYSISASILVMYWAWGTFPSAATRLLGWVAYVLLLAPVASISSLAVSWVFVRRSNWPFLAVTAGLAAGVLAVYVEAILIHFIAPRLLPDPFAASNLFPGIVTGGFVGYARSNKLEEAAKARSKATDGGST